MRVCHLANMARLAKRRLALLVALLAALGGGTAVAIAASGRTRAPRSHTRADRAARSGAPEHGILSAAAAYLGVPVSQLRADLASGKTLAEIANATPGKSAAGLVAALVGAVRERRSNADGADVTARVEALVDHQRVQHAFGARHNLIPVAGAYLGLTRHELLVKIRSGLTLAEIADATPGMSAQGLREALIASFEQRLSTLAVAHPLSQHAQAARLHRFEARVTRFLSRRHAPGAHAQHQGA